MNQIIPINIPKIQLEVRKRHGDFIGKYGSLIQKVVADNRLLTDLVASRLYHILLCFKEEHIVDDVKQGDGYPRKIVITKNGFDNYVNIITNGKKVRVEGYNIDNDNFMSGLQLPGQNFHGVDDVDYDWEKFSIELLDYIHASIYDRKDALEATISEVLVSRPKNKGV